MDNIQNFIYGLIDPRTDLVCYIGQSSRGMSRPRNKNRRGAVKEWIAELDAQALTYRIEVLEYVEDPSVYVNRCHWWTGINVSPLNDAERWWIAYGRALGWQLLNKTTGGEGTHGCIPNEETRAKQSIARNTFVTANPTARWGVALPEVRAQFEGENHWTKGPAAYEGREKIRVASTARFQTQKHRESAAVRLAGRWVTEHDILMNALHSPELREQRRQAISDKAHPIHSKEAIEKRSGAGHWRTRHDVSDDAIYTLRAMCNNWTHQMIADACSVSKACVTKKLAQLRL